MTFNLRLSAPLRHGLIINLVLIAMVLVTAMLLVRWQYTSRNLFVALEKSEAASRQLAGHHASALAEKRQLTSPARIERLASENLGMRAIAPPVTVYLTQP